METREDSPVQVSGVAVPGGAVDVASGAVDHGARVVGLVGVVVVGPDPGVVAGGAQRRADVLLRQHCRVRRRLVHRDVSAALVVERFVLQRDGVDLGPVGGERLQVFDEILRILRIVLRVEPVVVRVAGEDLYWGGWMLA